MRVGLEGDGSLSVNEGKVILGEADAESIKGGTVYMGPGGELRGKGEVDATHVINEHGLLSPGASPGVLTLHGDYEQLAEGFVEFHIGGTERGVSYSALDIVGDVTLDGGMMIWLEDGFLPQAGMTFDLIISGSAIWAEADPFTAVYVFGPDWVCDWSYSLDVLDGETLHLTSLNTVPVPATSGLLACLAPLLWYRRRVA